jgi:membrane fusion protein (multidrug efflux system)
MFVRAIVQEGVAEQAILAPQQGVSRTAKGEPFALIVDESGTVRQRMLTLNRAIGDQWLIASGLSAGERVIVEGLLNVRAGAVVRVVSLEPAKGGAEAPPSKTPPAGSN